MLEDIVGSLHGHGVQRFLVVNGHGGNSAVIATAIEEIKQETGVPLVAAIFGYALIAEQARLLLPERAIGHGGADEAAVAMAVDERLGKPHAFSAPELTGDFAESAALLRTYGGVLAAV